MDLIKEWIISLAGVITIASICDIIMIDGEMKKYLKPILGFVMIITVVQPIVGIGSEVSFNIPEVSAKVSTGFSEKIDGLEQKNITILYQQKLAKQIENELKSMSGDYINATAFVTADNSGEIKKITININQSIDMTAGEKVKETISKKFDVETSIISIAFEKGE